MTLTREPSGRRASQIGLEFVDAPADLADDALADVHELQVVGEAHARLLHLAADLDECRVGAVDHDVGDLVAREQRLQRAVAQHVVADVLEQLLLLGNRHHDVLDLDDLADDVANLLARRGGVQLGELSEIDGVDQRVEDRRLDVVVFLRVPALLVLRGARRSSRGLQRRGGLGLRALWGRGVGGRRLLRRSRCRDRDGALTEHAPGPYSLIFSFSSSGASGEDFFAGCSSRRCVMASAISRNAAADFALALSSSIIWPLLAACPKVSASKSMTLIAFSPSAVSNSLTLISGRFGMLTMFMTRRGLLSLRRG